MFRKLVLSVVVGSCVTLLLGCPKKKEDVPEAGAEEAGAVDAAPPPPAVPAAPAAKNSADVARFPAEKPLVDDAEKTADLFTQAKTGCKSGNNVALIKSGTDPFKIAEFQDCVLVTFPDPKDAAGCPRDRTSRRLRARSPRRGRLSLSSFPFSTPRPRPSVSVRIEEGLLRYRSRCSMARRSTYRQRRNRTKTALRRETS